MSKIQSVRLKKPIRLNQRGARILFTTDKSKADGYELVDAIKEDSPGLPGILITSSQGFEQHGKSIKVTDVDMILYYDEETVPKAESRTAPPPPAEISDTEETPPPKARRGRPPRAGWR